MDTKQKWEWTAEVNPKPFERDRNNQIKATLNLAVCQERCGNSHIRKYLSLRNIKGLTLLKISIVTISQDKQNMPWCPSNNSHTGLRE